MKFYYIYILASKQNGTLYIGVTNDLIKCVYEHKNNLTDGFTKKYNVHTLVYFEQCDDIESAIIREKQLKKWNRKWKLELIEKENPQWKDLYENLTDAGFPIKLGMTGGN
jgi:putative endonuclease